MDKPLTRTAEELQKTIFKYRHLVSYRERISVERLIKRIENSEITKTNYSEEEISTDLKLLRRFTNVKFTNT